MEFQTGEVASESIWKKPLSYMYVCA